MDNNNNGKKINKKSSLDLNALKRPRPTTRSSSANEKITKQNDPKDTEANNSLTTAIESTRKTKIAKLDLFRGKSVDGIIGSSKTTKGSQVINESSTSSPSIPLVVISPPSSASKTASGKTTSNKASSSSDKAIISKTSSSGDKSATSKAAAPKITTDQAVDSTELIKLIQISQRNSSTLHTILKNQEKLETMLNDQKNQISEIMEKLDSQRDIEAKTKGKAKSKEKEIDEFYLGAVRKLSYELFHEHRQVTEQEMKDRLKKKLESDDKTRLKLLKLDEKGVSFDSLWDDILSSKMLDTNRVKKGYYVRRLKECLWRTFGINRITPFKDSYSKEEMRVWKKSQKVQQVHEDLYKPSNSSDPSSDTYIALIIKSVFTSEKERTNENAIWVQSVLEVIFDEKHLSTKIDTDVVDTWVGNLTETEVDSAIVDSSSPKTPPIDEEEEIIGN